MELEEEILSDKISLAVLQFKAKNYRKCVSIYAELVLRLSSFEEGRVVSTRRFYGLSDRPPFGKLIHPKLCGILDQRAAAYEKLGAFRLARQDAERSIALDPVNCKGYLRLGKIHLIENDRVAAYKAYQQGVFFIKNAMKNESSVASTRLWQQLQSLYKELNSILKKERTSSQAGESSMSKAGVTKPLLGANLSSELRTNHSRGLQGRLDMMLPLKRATTLLPVTTKRQKSSKDIFEILPKELIELVFSNLSFGNILRSHLVCRLWYNTLVTIPGLYRGNFMLKHRATSLEYFQGLKLMKKVLQYLFDKAVHLLSVWSTLNMQHLGKILESVIVDQSLKLLKLHIIDKCLSMELFLKKLEKFNWSYTGLATVKHLRLGINSSLFNGSVLLNVFPNIESMEIICVDQLLRRTNMLQIPAPSSELNQLLSSSTAIQTHCTLKHLTLTNHPLLKSGHQSWRASEQTFDPRPPFLDISFCALTNLKISSYDFTGLAGTFQTFLKNAPLLDEVYLENNEELSLKKFLLFLSLNHPAFKLRKLTLRENHQEGIYGLDEIAAEDLQCIGALSHLDIYGSSISSTGFLKLLTLANKEGHMLHINVGHCSHIQFKNDSLLSGSTVLRFAQIFEIAPGIQSLFIPELSLDNLSLKFLKEDLSKTYTELCLKVNLRVLDLSFCHLIDGTGLMNLCRSGSARSRSLDQLGLDLLILHGMHFDPQTLKLLQGNGFVKNLQNDPFKKKWKTYGTNSLVLEHS